MKQTVVFGFDGVIHSYTSGWKGVTVIPDPPVPGIREAIQSIREAGYEVIVVSTRGATAEGIAAIQSYLDAHGIQVDGVQKEKPPAIVYIDDRAICFDGYPETLLSKIQNFKPWNKSANCQMAQRADGCDFCQKFDFAGATATVNRNSAAISLAICNTRFPAEQQFKFCPLCGRQVSQLQRSTT